MSYLDPNDPNFIERLSATITFMVFAILLALLMGSGMHCTGTPEIEVAYGLHEDLLSLIAALDAVLEDN